METFDRDSLRSLDFISHTIKDGRNYATRNLKGISSPRRGEPLVLSVRVLGVAPPARKLHCFIRYAWVIKGVFHVSLITSKTFQMMFSTVLDFIKEDRSIPQIVALGDINQTELKQTCR